MDTPRIYPRWIESKIAEALLDTPVVLLAGPRQAGKTTLVSQFTGRGMQFVNLDDEATNYSAQNDPVGMIRNLDLAIIDEIQRVPQLLLAIKTSVDKDRRPGRFLLTGSANLMALPTVADSLAGRMETRILLPLSQSEMENQKTNWVENVFVGNIPTATSPVLGDDLIERVLGGGYPDAISRPTERRRAEWFRQFINSTLQRDVRDVAEINKLDELPRLLSALAQSAGQISNYSRLGAKLGLDGKTVSRYINVFEQMYLIRRVDTWARNRLKRVVKSPKIQFLDSGLLSVLAGVRKKHVQLDKTIFGSVLESFVFSELLKHVNASDDDFSLLYFRDADKFEVDIVIENYAGQLVGVEVKASATFKEQDLRGLKKLSSLAGDQFKAGVLLYDTDQTRPLGNNMWAAPLSSLWGS